MECEESLNNEENNNFFFKKFLKNNNEFQQIITSLQKDQWNWRKPIEQSCPRLGYLKVYIFF